MPGLLDVTDQLAARTSPEMANPEPYVYLEETDTSFAIEWTGALYVSVRSRLPVYSDRHTGRVTHYPRIPHTKTRPTRLI